MRASIRCVVMLSSWLFIICLAHADEIPSTAVNQDREMPSKNAQPVATIKNKKWYFGGTTGLGGIKGEDTTAVDNYYSSLGYSDKCDCYPGEIGNGLGAFLGYRQQDYMDIELGWSWFESYHKIKYLNYTSQITTKRTFTADALYLSALFRPPVTAYYHGLYVKLGAHISRLEISKDPLTGYNVSQATLNTIAAGDNMAGDGISWGVGPLIGLGFDFRTGKVGAVRLEVDRYFRLGGTSYGVGSLNLGYLGNF